MSPNDKNNELTIKLIRSRTSPNPWCKH